MERTETKRHHFSKSLFVAALFLAGCSSDGPSPAASSSDTVSFSAEERFPYTSLEDARTFTDAFVLVKAIEDRTSEVEGGSNEGYRARWVTFQVVDHLWSRDNVPPVPERFEQEMIGLADRDGKDTKMSADGAPFVSVGSHYVLGMLTTERTPMVTSAVRSILPVADGRIDVDLPKVAAHPDNHINLDFRSKIDGMPVKDAIAIITSSTPAITDDIIDPEARLEQWLQRSEQGQMAPSTTRQG